jgi:peptidoglycan hydrolase-like protein with peptidoglycan-binding domain
MNDAQVMTLQQILNRSGFVIAPSGPGAPGSETSYFGAMTREAVRKFQCAKGIACDGSESTSGYGLVGPRTRAALIQ